MSATELLRRIGAFLPLVVGAILLPAAPEGLLSPGGAFALLASYSRLVRLALGLSTSEGALFLAETLPFLAFAASLGEGAGTAYALLSCLEGAAAGAALLSSQALALGERKGFTPALAFIAASCAAGFAMDRVAPAPFIAASAILLGLTRFASARRPI